MNGTAREEVWDGTPTSEGEAASLVESAMLLRWRAPELALLLSDRAVAAAADDRDAVLRAEHLGAFALNRLGRPSAAVQRLLPPLADTGTPMALRHELNVELAHCALALGEPAAALDVLHPVLAAGDDIAPMLRGTALVATAEAAGALGRADAVDMALEEADELYQEDPQLDHDTTLLLRAAASTVHAAHHRRSGSPKQALTQIRSSRDLLRGLADPDHDSGQVSGKLMLEQVLALLDLGEGETAVQEARPILRRPVRAAAACAMGWLRLALATRVHLAQARHEPALGLLADAVELTQRHGVDAVLAECLEGLSHVHEVRGEFADALHCLRSARAAEGRHRRSTEAARAALLQHCGWVRRGGTALVDEVTPLLAGSAGARIEPDPATGLLDPEVFRSWVDRAVLDSGTVSQVLVAVRPQAGHQPDALCELCDQLRLAAPEGAVFGRIGDDLIAVLLRSMNRQQAQTWLDEFRAKVPGRLRSEITAAAAQYRAGTDALQLQADAERALRAAANRATSHRVEASAAWARGAPPAPAPLAPDPELSRPEASNKDAAVPHRVAAALGWPELAWPQVGSPGMHATQQHSSERYSTQEHPRQERVSPHAAHPATSERRDELEPAPSGADAPGSAAPSSPLSLPQVARPPASEAQPLRWFTPGAVPPHQPSPLIGTSNPAGTGSVPEEPAHTPPEPAVTEPAVTEPADVESDAAESGAATASLAFPGPDLPDPLGIEPAGGEPGVAEADDLSMPSGVPGAHAPRSEPSSREPFRVVGRHDATPVQPQHPAPEAGTAQPEATRHSEAEPAEPEPVAPEPVTMLMPLSLLPPAFGGTPSRADSGDPGRRAGAQSGSSNGTGPTTGERRVVPALPWLAAAPTTQDEHARSVLDGEPDTDAPAATPGHEDGESGRHGSGHDDVAAPDGRAHGVPFEDPSRGPLFGRAEPSPFDDGDTDGARDREPVPRSEPAAHLAEEPGSESPRRRGDGAPVLVSDLLPAKTVLSSGRSGRRRAEDRVSSDLPAGQPEQEQAPQQAPQEAASAPTPVATEHAQDPSRDVPPRGANASGDHAAAPGGGRGGAGAHGTGAARAEFSDAHGVTPPGYRWGQRGGPAPVPPGVTFDLANHVGPAAHGRSLDGPPVGRDVRPSREQPSGSGPTRTQGGHGGTERPAREAATGGGETIREGGGEKPGGEKIEKAGGERAGGESRVAKVGGDEQPHAGRPVLGDAAAVPEPAAPDMTASTGRTAADGTADARAEAETGARGGAPGGTPRQAAPPGSGASDAGRGPVPTSDQGGGTRPRVEPGDSGPDTDQRVGMGDLLAEALAAFQESHPPLISTNGSHPPDTEHDTQPVDGAAAQAELAARLHLAADPVDRYPGDAGDALTDPVLRLPELAAEPPWRQPGGGLGS